MNRPDSTAGHDYPGRPDAWLRACFEQRTTATAALLAVHLLWLLGAGRPWGCIGGDTFAWQPGSGIAHNSQHLADWYSLLHAGFGIGLAWALRTLRPRWQRRDAWLVALACSTVWEVVENTPFVISLLDNTTNMAPDYSGDSVVNSLADTGWVLLGFWLAWRMPGRWALAVIVLLELTVSLAIADGWVLTVFRLIAGLLGRSAVALAG